MHMKIIDDMKHKKIHVYANGVAL